MGRSLGQGPSRSSFSLEPGGPPHHCPALPPTPKPGDEDFPLPPTQSSLCQGPADGGQGGGLPGRERKQRAQSFCAGPTAQARLQEEATWSPATFLPGLSPDLLEQSKPPWAGGFRPQTVCSSSEEVLGEYGVGREPGSSAHDPEAQVPAARPRPLPTSQIIQSQPMSPHLPAGRTLRSLAGQGPRTVDGWVEPSSGEERAAATATTSRCSGRLSAGCRVTKNASRVAVMLAAATRRVLACTRPRARRSACPTPRLTLTATLRGKDGSPHFTDGNSEAENGEVTGPRSQHQCLGGRVERRVRSTPCWTRAREGGAVNPDGPSPLELASPPHLSFGRNLSHTLTWARFPGGFREGPTRDVKRLPHRREIATCHLDDCAS